MRSLVVCFFLMASCASAQDNLSENQVVPKEVFSFPEFPVSSKDPIPTPMPVDPSVPPTLRPGLLYVVPSDEKFNLSAYPPGLVTIRSVNSPLNVYGEFWDEDGEDERTYTQPFIYIVKAVPGKVGDIYLVYTPSVDRGDDTITSMLIRIGAAPQPPPKPDTPDEPDDPVEPDEPEPDSDLQTFKSLIKATTDKYSELPESDKGKLAQAFREAAKKIETGEIKNPGQELTKVTADLMVDKLGLNSVLLWIPWRDDVTKVLKTQPFMTIKDHVGPWNVIADVLEGK